MGITSSLFLFSLFSLVSTRFNVLYYFALVPYWICEKTSFVLSLYKVRTCSLLFSSVDLKSFILHCNILLCDIILYMVKC